MASARNRPPCPKDLIEYMAAFQNANAAVIDVDNSSGSDSDGDEVKVVNEFDGPLTHHRCDLCCEGEFLVHKLLRYGGLINEKYKFVCDKCDDNFAHNSELVKHVSECTGSVVRKKSKNVSLVGEQAPKVKCTACLRMFKSQSGLTRHIKSQHSRLTHTCELCKKVFTCFQKFRHHCLQHELRRPNIMCNICDKSYHSETKLKKHMKSHDI